MNWVLSMIIGNCINGVFHAIKWLFWKDTKPSRTGLFLSCLVAGPAGYFIGLSIGMLIYGLPVTGVLDIMSHGDRLIVIMCILITLAAGVFFWNRSQLAEALAQTEKEKARASAIEKQAMQAQLQLLQAQIEPHMLFNTLANLQGLIALDAPRAQYMLEQLITYLRASLSSSRSETTTLKHEFDLMRAYLELLAIRMGKRLTYTLDLPAELQACQIAPMLLQPLVENAIKHGLEPKMDGGHIHVTATLDNGALGLTVADTGLGLPFDYDDNMPVQDDQQHVGNANVRERLLALYGKGASLTLSANQPEGVLAQLIIPIQA
jgi:sensor histidine kinase YesM